MPDLKHWLARRKAQNQLKKRTKEAIANRPVVADVDLDLRADKQLKESKNRRKKFSKKVKFKRTKEGLERGAGGPYKLKGDDDYNTKNKFRKKKGKNVIKEKHVTYTIPGQAKETETTTTKTPKLDKIEFQSTNSGVLDNNKYATDWKEKTKEEMKSAGLKGKKSFDVDEPGISSYNYEDSVDKKKYTPNEKKNMKAAKVAYMDPDTLKKTKYKAKFKRGEKKASKIKEKIVKENLVSKDYRGVLNPQKNSKKRVKVGDEKGGYKKTITKVRKGGDKITTKTKTKIKRENIDGGYRQHKKKNIKLKRFAAKIKSRLKNR